MKPIMIPALAAAMAAAPLAAHAQMTGPPSNPSLQNTTASFPQRGTFERIQVRGTMASSTDSGGISGTHMTLSNGYTVVITDGTRIHKSALRPGAVLNVTGVAGAGGTIIADEITGTT